MVAPCAAVRSTRSTELPLQPTCTPTHAPARGGEAGRPGHDHGGGVQPGTTAADPRAATARRSTVCRCGVRSRSWRPVKSSSSTWSSASGQHDLEAVDDVRRPGRCWSRWPGRAARRRPPPPARRPAPARRPRSSAAHDAAGSSSTSSAGRAEPRRPRACASDQPVAAQVRPGEPAAGVLAEQRHARAVGDQRRSRRRPSPSVGRAEPRAPRAGPRRRRRGRRRCAGRRRCGAREQHGEGLPRSWATRVGQAGRPGSGAARALRRACVAAASALDGARGQAADEEPLQGQEHDDRHDHRDEAAGGGELPALADAGCVRPVERRPSPARSRRGR